MRKQPRKALVTTTINPPTDQLRAWLAQINNDDAHVVIVADIKTPHELYNDLLFKPTMMTYLMGYDSPYEKLEAAVGHGTIQRRNLGFLAAVDVDPWLDYVITVDDDNEPRFGWVELVDDLLRDVDRPHLQFLPSADGWVNPGALTAPPTVHRGFPIARAANHRQDAWAQLSDADQYHPIGVFCSLITGDPDISAIERMITGTEVYDVLETIKVPVGMFAPFNTQATAFRRELLPAMHLWLSVGRYDDIFASLVTERVMWELGWSVAFGEPSAHQVRNPHNLMKDFEQELFGYRRCEDIAEVIRTTDLTDCRSERNVVDMTAHIFNALEDALPLPSKTFIGFRRWIDECRRLEVEHGPIFTVEEADA
jgi:hypothetical protein